MAATIRILIADDEPGIRMVAGRALRSAGFEVAEYENGRDAYRAASSERFDLLILDVNMDGMDGFTITQKLREQKILTPILIVTGNDEEYNEVYGFSIGADDYIIKPFRPSALSARVQAILRRQGLLEAASHILKAGPFTIDRNTQLVYKNGKELTLTPKERQLMQYFLENQGHALSKEQIYKRVWRDNAVDNNTIMVSIRNLRQKIEDDPSNPVFILTVYGVGYRFVCPDPASTGR